MCSQKGDACGALVHPVFRRHSKVGDIPGKGLVSKDAAVPHQKHRFRQVCKFLLQLRQGNGAVFGDPFETAVVDIKQRIIHLTPPGVHYGTHVTLIFAQGKRHGFQRADAVAGHFPAPRETLRGGNADAHAGKGAGACGHGHRVYVVNSFAALMQQIFRHDHQGLAVGQAGVLVAFRQKFLVLQQRRGGGFRAGFKG